MRFPTNRGSLTHRSLALLTAQLGTGLAFVSGVILLLALVASRALPDGGAIGFLSSQDGNTDIYVLDIVRGTLHNVTDNGAVNGSFAFSPDGTRIAFESNKDGNTEIYMMNVECHSLFSVCGGIQQLTDNETDSRHPVWSPDGRQIAYVYDVSHEDGDNEIYVMDVESGDIRNLTNNSADDNWPAWSLDGSQVTFVSDRDANSEVYLSSGGDLQSFTTPGRIDACPSWSPTRPQVAFVSYGEGVPVIHVGDIAERHLIPVATGANFVTCPVWSPDGNRIAFASDHAAVSALYVADIADGSLTQLVVSEGNWNGSPAWSSDADWIIFATRQNNQSSIRSIDIQGKAVRSLATVGRSSAPTWWP